MRTVKSVIEDLFTEKKIQPTCKNTSVVTQQKLKLRIGGCNFGECNGLLGLSGVSSHFLYLE